MKKYIYTFGLFMCAVLFVSCEDYLDKLPNDQITEDEAFSRFTKVDELVTDLYAKSKNANRPLAWFYHFSTAAITDECEGTTVEKSITNSFNTGDWSINNLPGSNGQYWWDLYEGIRKANIILEGVEKYKTPDNPSNPGELAMRIGEVYFHRAYLHYLVLRIYGEAPYIDYVVDPYQSMDFKQESVHSLAAKIEADAKEAFNRLPATWVNGIHYGRVDQGACLGLIAISKWTVATPMWNGAKDHGYEGQRIFESEYTYDAKRWENAKVAAKAVLDFKLPTGEPRYKLYQKYSNQDYNDSGGQNTSNSTVYARLWNMYYDMDSFGDEAIWLVTRDKTQGWMSDIYPPSRSGSARQQPVQEQVDEYEYISSDGFGYPIYSQKAVTDGYDDENPYLSVKRDPRFYRDIIFHGASFRDGKNNPSVLNTADGADKINASNATKTGYYLRKYLQEAWNKNGNFRISAPPVWRLPDFIYIYAEAVNETAGPNQAIYDLVNEVRARSFMVPMPPQTKTDKNLMREYIKRERRVEFFYENKRAFDTRLYLESSDQKELDKENKWLAAGANNNDRSKNYWTQFKTSYPKVQRMINGMRPIEDTNGKIIIKGKKYRMERFCVEERVFNTPRHYLFPIQETELQRAPTLIQNPGW